MTISHGRVKAGGNLASRELKDLELALARHASERTRAKVGDTVEVTVEPRGDLFLASDDLATHGRRWAIQTDFCSIDVGSKMRLQSSSMQE